MKTKNNDNKNNDVNKENQTISTMKRTKLIILYRSPGNATNDKVSKLKALSLAIMSSPCAFWSHVICTGLPKQISNFKLDYLRPKQRQKKARDQFGSQVISKPQHISLSSEVEHKKFQRSYFAFPCSREIKCSCLPTKQYFICLLTIFVLFQQFISSMLISTWSW